MFFALECELANCLHRFVALLFLHSFYFVVKLPYFDEIINVYVYHVSYFVSSPEQKAHR